MSQIKIDVKKSDNLNRPENHIYFILFILNLLNWLVNVTKMRRLSIFSKYTGCKLKCECTETNFQRIKLKLQNESANNKMSMCSYESYFYAQNDKTEKLPLLSQKLSELTKNKLQKCIELVLSRKSYFTLKNIHLKNTWNVEFSINNR